MLARIIIFLYRHRKLYNRVYGALGRVRVQDGPRVSREHDIRLFILGCIDLLLSLPVGLLIIIVDVEGALEAGTFSFYPGWNEMHAHWQPRAVAYGDLPVMGWPGLVDFYFSKSSSFVLGFSLFALFGFTEQACAVYAEAYWGTLGLFGRKRSMQSLPALDLPVMCSGKYGIR